MGRTDVSCLPVRPRIRQPTCSINPSGSFPVPLPFWSMRQRLNVAMDLGFDMPCGLEVPARDRGIHRIPARRHASRSKHCLALAQPGFTAKLLTGWRDAGVDRAARPAGGISGSCVSADGPLDRERAICRPAGIGTSGALPDRGIFLPVSAGYFFAGLHLAVFR